MEEISKRSYLRPYGIVKNIRTSILCGSYSNIPVGGNTDKPFDARKRETVIKESTMSID